MENNLECKNCGKKIYWSGNFKVYAHQSLLDQKNCERPEPDMFSFRPAPSQPSRTGFELDNGTSGTVANTHYPLEVRDEKIARIVKEFREKFPMFGETLEDDIRREEEIEKWLTQTLTTLLNEE